MLKQSNYLDLNKLVEDTHADLLNMKDGILTTAALIFPRYSCHCSPRYANKMRFSEQEARFIFINNLERFIKEQALKLCYSVETPTTLAYTGFSKKIDTPQIVPRIGNIISRKQGCASSASIDLSIHYSHIDFDSPDFKLNDEFLKEKMFENIFESGDTPFPRVMNIEFKYGIASVHSIAKDFLKIYAESGTGFWFHYYVGDLETRRAIDRNIAEAKQTTMNCIDEYHRQHINCPLIDKTKTVYKVVLDITAGTNGTFITPIIDIL